MLEITLYLSPDGRPTALEFSGHAGMARRGKDLVCAGISAIIQTALAGLLKVLRVQVGYQQKDGYMYISLPADLEPAVEEKAQMILETAMAGIEGFEAQYPKKIRINRKTI